jgi:hypothetical protein
MKGPGRRDDLRFDEQGMAQSESLCAFASPVSQHPRELRSTISFAPNFYIKMTNSQLIRLVYD